MSIENIANQVTDPEDIPTNPGSAYKTEWISFTDWLGNGNISSQEKSKQYIPYNEAKSFAQSLKLNSREEWMELLQIRQETPSTFRPMRTLHTKIMAGRVGLTFLGYKRVVKYI